MPFRVQRWSQHFTESVAAWISQLWLNHTFLTKCQSFSQVPDSTALSFTVMINAFISLVSGCTWPATRKVSEKLVDVITDLAAKQPSVCPQELEGEYWAYIHQVARNAGLMLHLSLLTHRLVLKCFEFQWNCILTLLTFLSVSRLCWFYTRTLWFNAEIWTELTLPTNLCPKTQGKGLGWLLQFMY